MKKKNELLEKDVEKIRQRQKLLDDADLLRIKLPFILFSQKQKEGKLLREQLTQAKKALQDFEAKGSPLDADISKLRDKKQRISDDQQDEKNTAQALKREIQNIIHKLEDLSAKGENYRNNLDSLKSRQADRQKKVAEVKR